MLDFGFLAEVVVGSGEAKIVSTISMWFASYCSPSSGSKIESNFMGISPSFIDRFSASMSSSVRWGGFSIALMRRCAAGFFFVVGSCFCFDSDIGAW